MALLKNLLLAFVAIAVLSIATPASAAGKIEKATTQEVAEAIVHTIALTEETVAAIKNGIDTKAALALFKKIKQSSKKIESNIVDRLRSKANQRIVKARSAMKKGDTAKAIALTEEATEIFKEVKVKHANF